MTERGVDGHPIAREALPSWLSPHDPENRLPVVVAIAVAVTFQLLVPPSYGLQPRWLAPALEVLLVAVLAAMRLTAAPSADRADRLLGLVVVAAITVDNTASAFFLARGILTGTSSGNDPERLLITGAAVYCTNIVAFAIWYWELDRGGPAVRAEGSSRVPDFLFPQMSLNHRLVPKGWHPRFLDYLYLAYTNVLAFSPTDVMPLSRWSKALMTAQSLTAFVTTALVLARAVNILK